MMEEHYCPWCGSRFFTTDGSGRVFCSSECRKESSQAKKEMDMDDLFHLNYTRAQVSNQKLTQDAMEARQKGISYGRLILSREEAKKNS